METVWKMMMMTMVNHLVSDIMGLEYNNMKLTNVIWLILIQSTFNPDHGVDRVPASIRSQNTNSFG